jgi:hypothetical protein
VGLGRPEPAGRPAALRLFLDGDGPLTATLYELLFNNVAGVVFRDPNGQTVVEVPPAEALRQVGFTTRRARADHPPADDADEGAIPTRIRVSRGIGYSPSFSRTETSSCSWI